MIVLPPLPTMEVFEECEEIFYIRNFMLNFPFDKFNEVASHPDVRLPTCAGIHKVCESPEEIIEFICKFEDPRAFVDINICRLVPTEGDNVYVESFTLNDELVDESEFLDPSQELAWLLDSNPYRPDEERCGLRVTKCLKLVPANIKLLEEYKYPVLVHYQYDSGGDRIGSYSVNSTKVIELNMTDKSIQVYSL